jgi:hypothetical protein
MAHWVKTTESSLTTAGKAFRSLVSHVDLFVVWITTRELTSSSQLKNPNLFLESGFIDGQHVRAGKGDVFEVTDPADGSLLGVSILKQRESRQISSGAIIDPSVLDVDSCAIRPAPISTLMRLKRR